MKKQDKDQFKATPKKAPASKKATNVSNEDLKDVRGGSGLLGGSGLDITNVIAGTLGTESNSSGSHNGHSYTSSDDRRVDFGLGQDSSNVSY